MASSAQAVFRELDSGVIKPFYAIVGDEPFQTSEICHKIRIFFSQDQNDFNYETFDSDGLEASKLLASLEMLPGLFDSAGAARLVRCDRFDKLSASNLEILDPYFQNPLASTAFLILAGKVDKRRSWVKAVMEKGHLIEVAEPYDRDWPKWLAYFEKKAGKKISGDAWEYLVENGGKKLSLVWQELEKVALYIGTRHTIALKDVRELLAPSSENDVFQFAEDVIAKNRAAAMKRYEALLRSGESEIKILSILVRQFRMVDQCQRLMKKGITDPKMLGPKLGTHPFFVPKIQTLARGLKPAVVGQTLNALAEADYRLKTGTGDLFESFLVGHV